MMRKHILSPGLTTLLAFSLAFSSVCAAEKVLPAQAEIAAEEAVDDLLNKPAAEDSQTEMPTHYSLNFDKKTFQKQTAEVNGVAISFRVYEDCRYTSYPVASQKEQLSLYVPEAYFNKKSINKFTARTAPIIMPLTVRDSNSGTNSTDHDSELQALVHNALAHGYVVVVPNTLDLISAENERLGKAPLYLLEAKSALRYLYRNHHRLPAGDLNRLVVVGQNLGGSLALQLAASCNQENYHPYLRGLGAAERSDHVFAAQAYGPDLNLAEDVSRFGWILPDGRPDPYAVSRYVPLIDLDTTLGRSLTSPKTDTVFLDYLPPEDSAEYVAETMDGTIEEAAADKSSRISKGDDTSEAKAGKPANHSDKVIYDTKAYRDYLVKKAAYEKAKKDYEAFVKEHEPASQNANYLRLSSDSENENLKDEFEKTGTTVTVLTPSSSLTQDINELFNWIDEADIQQDAIDEELAKLRKKEQEKLARAKLLYDRASASARKQQAKIERQALKNGGKVPYSIITPKEEQTEAHS